MSEKLSCPACESVVLEYDAEYNTAVVRGTVVAKAEGEGVDVKCWGCANTASFGVELRFVGAFIFTDTQVPKGESMFVFPAGVPMDQASVRVEAAAIRGPYQPGRTSLLGVSYDQSSGSTAVIHHASPRKPEGEGEEE